MQVNGSRRTSNYGRYKTMAVENTVVSGLDGHSATMIVQAALRIGWKAKRLKTGGNGLKERSYTVVIEKKHLNKRPTDFILSVTAVNQEFQNENN